MKNFWTEIRAPDGDIRTGGDKLKVDVYQLSGKRSHKTVQINAWEKDNLLYLQVEIEDLDGEIAYNTVISIKGYKPEKL